MTGLDSAAGAAPVRHSVSEAEFQRQIIQLAELHHWRVGHFHDSRRQVRPGVMVGDKYAAGIPDLVLVRERVIWAELKAEKGRISISQRLWLSDLARAGAEVYLWRPSDLEEAQRILSLRWRLTHDGLEDRWQLWQPASAWVAGRGRVDEAKAA